MIVGQPKPVPYLVTIVKAESGIRTGRQGVTSVNSSADVSDLNKVLEEHGVSLKLLFGHSEDRIKYSYQSLLDKAICTILEGNENAEAERIYREVRL
jgi:hypothetical protein